MALEACRIVAATMAVFSVCCVSVGYYETQCPRQEYRKPEDYFKLDAETAWKIYDSRLAELEVRAFRAYKMNYDNAHYYEDWSNKMYCVSCIAALAGPSLFAIINIIKIIQPNWIQDQNQPNLVQAALVSGSGWSLPSLMSKGPEFLFPAFEKRVMRHVEAGSEYLNVHRRANIRRLQLRQMDLENGFDHKNVSEWCNELAGMYRDASKISPIPESTYQQYLKYSKLKETLDDRRRYLTEYMKDLPNSNQPGHMIAKREESPKTPGSV